MKKAQLSVYLDPKLAADLARFAEARRKSQSLVAEAAIAAFLAPDDADRPQAAIARRLDRLSRQLDRLERDTGIGLETLALFIRFWLAATPAIPDDQQAAAEAKGRERYARFMEALGQRLASRRDPDDGTT